MKRMEKDFKVIACFTGESGHEKSADMFTNEKLMKKLVDDLMKSRFIAETRFSTIL